MAEIVQKPPGSDSAGRRAYRHGAPAGGCGTDADGHVTYIGRAAVHGLLLLSLSAAGCGTSAKPVTPITLATTTSTRDSGLLDALLPLFERQIGIEVQVIAVGSGQALEMGRRGDADVLLTHVPGMPSAAS